MSGHEGKQVVNPVISTRKVGRNPGGFDKRISIKQEVSGDEADHICSFIGIFSNADMRAGL
jgi:hypothetical protein